MNKQKQPETVEAPEETAAPGPVASGESPPEAADPTGEQDAIAPVEAEQEEAESLEDQVERWKDLALRSRAELENYRKRMAAEKAAAIRYANQSLFESLLPVLDNFNFGLDAARDAQDAAGVLKGMEMVQNQLETFLADQNITEIPANAGCAFDPSVHEAMAQQHHPDVPEGKVIKVIRKGFKLGDRLVRAVNVIVSKGPQTGAHEEDSKKSDTAATDG